jgi:putative membrane protein
MAEEDQPVKADPNPAQLVDASRRTYLAGERTQLAWWRTGLTALAVALGVGRVVPELSKSAARWP